MNAFRLDGKVAVVTGSSRGIGRSIAEHLAAHGAKVVISSRKQGPCEEVAQAIRAGGGEAIAVPANIAEKAQLEQLVAQTRKHFGQIDILVCNAASNPYFGPMSGLPDEAFQKILQNNIVANHWLANLVAPEMAQRRDGVIIIVSSIGGLEGQRRAGRLRHLQGGGHAARAQPGGGVGQAQHPGQLHRTGPGEDRFRPRAVGAIPSCSRTPRRSRRWGASASPDDIGGIAVFLASRAGAFVTGQTIVADGGITITG